MVNVEIGWITDQQGAAGNTVKMSYISKEEGKKNSPSCLCWRFQGNLPQSLFPENVV